MDGGTIRQRILLTPSEVRALSDACLRGLGWAPATNARRTP
jgi:hypothetical protein